MRDIRIGFVGQQQVDHAQVAAPGRVVERGAAERVAFIDRSAFFQQRAHRLDVTPRAPPGATLRTTTARPTEGRAPGGASYFYCGAKCCGPARNRNREKPLKNSFFGIRRSSSGVAGSRKWGSPPGLRRVSRPASVRFPGRYAHYQAGGLFEATTSSSLRDRTTAVRDLSFAWQPAGWPGVSARLHDLRAGLRCHGPATGHRPLRSCLSTAAGDCQRRS